MEQRPSGGGWSRNHVLIGAGAAVGLVYGVAARLLAKSRWSGMAVMTIGFTFLMPFAMGFITICVAEIKRAQRVRTWCLLPWTPLLAALAAMMLMLLEGAICIVMFAPLGLALATLGGLAGGISGRIIRSRHAKN